MSSRRGSEKSVAELLKNGAPGTSKSMILQRRGYKITVSTLRQTNAKKGLRKHTKIGAKIDKMQLRRRHKKNWKNHRFFFQICTENVSKWVPERGGRKSLFPVFFSPGPPLGPKPPPWSSLVAPRTDFPRFLLDLGSIFVFRWMILARFCLGFGSIGLQPTCLFSLVARCGLKRGGGVGRSPLDTNQERHFVLHPILPRWI